MGTVFRLTVLAALFLMLASCSSDFEIPERPANVPAQATWIGGLDGGVWVLMSKPSANPEGVYFGEVFGDHSGKTWYRGRFKIDSSPANAINLSDPSTFGVWDGDNLLLSDGRTLIAIDEFDPFQ